MHEVTDAIFYFADKTSAIVSGETAKQLHKTFTQEGIRNDAVINFDNQSIVLSNVIRIEWIR